MFEISRMSLAPYDAVMLASYGGPYKPEDVLPFMRNATKGRGIPDSRLLQVSEHYNLFGGASPINERNQELAEAIRQELAARNVRIPVVIGNRNWYPFFTETLRELHNRGARRVLVLLTAAYASYSGCRQYRENIAEALTQLGMSESEMQIDKVRPYCTTSGFIQGNVEATIAALQKELPSCPSLAQKKSTRVLFVTHSIPTRMQEGSSGGRILDYVAQHRQVIAEVSAQVSAKVGWDIGQDLVYCSRSGSPHQSWLEPDVNDRMSELANAGVKTIITVPIGFITDHMEVVYDLDTEAAATAKELGLNYGRAASCGTHPAFVSSLVDVMEERAVQARMTPGSKSEFIPYFMRDPLPIIDHAICPEGCCMSAPGAEVLASVCSTEVEERVSSETRLSDMRVRSSA